MQDTPTFPITESPRCYVLFSTTPSLLSRSIRWATGSSVSHAAIAYECGTTGRVMVMEASGSGFRGVTWENWLRENELLHAFQIEVEAATWQHALAGFCDTLGTPYDSRRLVLELVRHVSRDWTQRFSWANTKTNVRGVLCADAIADFLHRVGFHQFTCPPAWTPASLLAGVEADDGFCAMSIRGGLQRMPLRQASRSVSYTQPALRAVS